MEKSRAIITVLLVILIQWTNNPLCAQEQDASFEEFLSKFTSSASFQYSRIKFPLESEIVLMDENQQERSFPFTKEKWPLLNSEMFSVGRVELEEGGTIVSKYVLVEPDRREFESGYEESELDLRVVFQRIGGKWFVIDCYNAWYSFDLLAEELEEVIEQVTEENRYFREDYP